MKKYARIEIGSVVELFETDGDITKMFHPSIVWVDCTAVAGCAVGWTYSGGEFAAPIPAAEPNPNDTIQAHIDEIERATLTNRGAREGWIALILQQATAAGKTQTDLLDPVTGNPYFRKLVEIDTQIRALRSQLK